MAERAQAEVIPSLSLDEAYELFLRRQATFVDVRDLADFERAHIPGSRSIPLPEIPRRHGELLRERTLALYCA
ncbi:MAG: rhodanese-like domain-containing protein [Chloroflexi bacterium]|nr:rhodanese-like domain-containing protein [Chloroflexota bacterium]